MRAERVASWAGFMKFWGMTHPDQVRALRPHEFKSMHDFAVDQIRRQNNGG